MLFHSSKVITNYPPVYGGGGGGGGRSPSSPQQACVLFTSSVTACGVQEKRPILRKTVNKIKAIFFILYNLNLDTGVPVRNKIRGIWQHVIGKGTAFQF